MKKILKQAAKLGNATVRALFWYEREQSEFLSTEGAHIKNMSIFETNENLQAVTRD